MKLTFVPFYDSSVKSSRECDKLVCPLIWCHVSIFFHVSLRCLVSVSTFFFFKINHLKEVLRSCFLKTTQKMWLKIDFVFSESRIIVLFFFLFLSGLFSGRGYVKRTLDITMWQQGVALAPMYNCPGVEIDFTCTKVGDYLEVKPWFIILVTIYSMIFFFFSRFHE